MLNYYKNYLKTVISANYSDSSDEGLIKPRSSKLVESTESTTDAESGTYLFNSFLFKLNYVHIMCS